MGYFYAIMAAVTWGLVYALDQKILDKLSPSLLVVINSLFSLIVLIPIVLWYTKDIGTLQQLDKSTIITIAIALICTLAANILIYVAIQHLGSSKASIFEIAYPFFVVLFSYFLYQGEINVYFILGSILLFIGSAIIVTMG